MFELSGIFGFIIFALDVWAIIRIWNSKAEDFHKAVWIAVVVFMPLLGFIIWWFVGPKSEDNPGV
jgi:succinate dehydrogenase/fumarate reductase cytochrome b subunit